MDLDRIQNLFRGKDLVEFWPIAEDYQDTEDLDEFLEGLKSMQLFFETYSDDAKSAIRKIRQIKRQEDQL